MVSCLYVTWSGDTGQFGGHSPFVALLNSTSTVLCAVLFYVIIKKTRLYNFDPLKPHFYIVKLGFTGVYIIFLISAQNIDCGYSLEPPRRGGSNEYPQSMFWADIWKLSEFFIWKFSFSGGKIFYIFKKACSRNVCRWMRIEISDII